MPTRVLAVLALLLFALGAGTEHLTASLQAAARDYVADAGAIARYSGHDTLPDYYQRLFDDQQYLKQAPPRGYTPAPWTAFVREVAVLDLSLIHQLRTASPAPMRAIRGLGETLVRSSKDGTMQPVAVYVPPDYHPGTRTPLIVFLHGRLQSESELMAPGYIQRLAARNGTIVIAPYGRGHYDFRGTVTDVYDALAAAEQAFTVDPRRRYLVGYSMGAFSVFKVAPVHPNDWAAVMAIAGDLLAKDAPQVLARLRFTRFYVLTGSADTSVPTRYPTLTAQYLRQQRMAISFYSQPGGIHRLITLRPILDQAWRDMLAGIVRAPPAASGPIALPPAPPGSMQKT